MNSRALRRVGLMAGVATTSALVLAGCAGGGGATPSADPDEKVTLTLATFNDFGYTDELLAEYTKEHPNVTIVHNKAATSNDARANYFQKLGNSGLADVEAVEIDWFTEAMQYSDLLAPVADDLKGRWLDWKEAAATDAAGNLIAIRHRHRPAGHLLPLRPVRRGGPAHRPRRGRGSCSRATGTTSSPSATSTRRHRQGRSSTPPTRLLQGMVNQVEAAYEDPDGTIIATDQPRHRGRLRPGCRREGHPDLGLLGSVERGLVRIDGERRVRCHALPRMDARRHLGQRSRHHGLGHR